MITEATYLLPLSIIMSQAAGPSTTKKKGATKKKQVEGDVDDGVAGKGKKDKSLIKNLVRCTKPSHYSRINADRW